MRNRRDDGYVMGFALAVLIVLSMTATVLMTMAGSELRSVRAAEDSEEETLRLHAAAILGAAALATDPAQRTIAFRGGAAATEIGGQTIRLSASWESDRLDVNHAPLEEIRAALDALSISPDDKSRAAEAISQRRNRSEPVSLLDDVLAGVDGAECVRQALTVHGGKSEWQRAREATEIGWPAPGSRLRLLVERDGAEQFRAREYVILVTGNPAEPAHIIDIRPVLTRTAAECRI